MSRQREDAVEFACGKRCDKTFRTWNSFMRTAA